MSCGTCLDLLRYPVTLSCGHSLCKPCILQQQQGGPGINAVCPLCSAPTHFEREADLKVNAALQRSVDVLRGDAAPMVACSRCETTEATVECEDCTAKFCSACSDLIHVGKLRSHRLAYSPGAIGASRKPPPCEQRGHEDYRMDLYCTDCNVLLCVICAQTAPTHRAHSVVPLRQAAEVEAKKLRATLEAADRFRAELRSVSKALDETTRECEQSTRAEVEAFEATVSDLLELITRRRDETIEAMLRAHRDEMLKVRRAKEQVVQLASMLNDAVGSCQRALAASAHVDIITGRVEMERQLGASAPVVVPQVKPPMIHFARFQDIVSGIDAIAVGHGTKDSLPTAVLEATSIFQPRGFKFCKSTYNEVQLLNRGFSALSTGRTWETVMADTLLSVGTHFYEVRLDRYDASNGHNIVIGLVFDGGFELCEVLGEDSNSVGFNCGRGTKCVDGDFMQPYGQPCAAGDVVGVKINFNEGTVTYYRNGVSMGTAFTGLQRACYAAVSLINTQQVTLMFPATVPA
jgi:hypothetical protein